VKTLLRYCAVALVAAIFAVQTSAYAASNHCSTPFRDARLLKAVPPSYPQIAGRAGARGAVLVNVTVVPNGRPTARIAKSSGNLALDGSTLAAARRSTYLPKLVNCKAVVGHYLFRATFSGAP